MFVVNRIGLALINQVEEFYQLADLLGAPINGDDIYDDSLIHISGCLSHILSEKGITEDDFNKIGLGNWELCLPYLTQTQI